MKKMIRKIWYNHGTRFILFILALIITFVIAMAGESNAGGVSIQPAKIPDRIFARYNGLIGDSTDETVAMQAFFAKGDGITLVLDSGKTYFVTDSLPLLGGSKLNMNGSKIQFEIENNEKGLILAGNNEVYGGSIDVDTVEGVGGGVGIDGNYTNAITIGQGDIEYTDWIQNFNIHDITLSTEGWHCIGIIGASRNIDISNIIVPTENQSTFLQAHWGYYINGADTVTYHPNNINVWNVKVEYIKSTFAYISAAYNVKFENVECDYTSTGFFIYAGDWGWHYADSNFIDTIALRGQSIIIENSRILRAYTGGVIVQGYPNNSGIFTAYGAWPAPVSVRNSTFRRDPDSGATNSYGVRSLYTQGLMVDNNDISGFGTGVSFSTSSTSPYVINNHIYDCTHRGIHLDDATFTSSNVWISGNTIYNTGTVSDSGIGVDAVRQGSCYILGNTFGDSSITETQYSSVTVTGGLAHVADNHTLNIRPADSGAYQLYAGAKGDNNTTQGAITIYSIQGSGVLKPIYPLGIGNADQMLTDDGTGILSWTTPPGAGGGEVNTLTDSGAYDDATGYGLAAGKTGLELKVKGLEEGTGIVIAKVGDSALSISSEVSKVGTPVNDQIGIWTGDGPIEGDANLTFDGSILTSSAGFRGSLFPDATSAIAATGDMYLSDTTSGSPYKLKDLILNETITLSGDVSGSGETAITTTIEADKIDSSHIIDESVAEDDLLFSNAPTDEFVATWEASAGTGGQMTWEAQSGGSGLWATQGNADTIYYSSEAGDTLIKYFTNATNDTTYMIAGDGKVLVIGSPGVITVVDSLTADSIYTEKLVIGTSVVFANQDFGDISFTSNVAAVEDLTITSEATGDVLYFNGSNWIRLAVGTNGQVLKSNGTIPGWAAEASAGLWTASNDSLFYVDGDGDTTMVISDVGDAGAVIWGIGSNQSTLQIGDSGVTHITDLKLGINDGTDKSWLFPTVKSTVDGYILKYTTTGDSLYWVPDNSYFSDSLLSLLNGPQYSMFFTNATTTAIQNITHGLDGEYLMSNGPTSDPSWESVSGSGDVTDVIGGNGLADDGSSGDITLWVRPGVGIDTASDLVIVDYDVGLTNLDADNDIDVDTSTIATRGYADDAAAGANIDSLRISASRDGTDYDNWTKAIRLLFDNGLVANSASDSIGADTMTVDVDTTVIATLNALNDTTATKLPLAGGTMSGDIAMGTNGITGVDYLTYVPQATEAHAEAKTYYDSDLKAWIYYNDESEMMVCPGRGVVTRVYNNSGATILKGKAVYISGGAVSWPTIELAKADNANTAKTLGLAAHDIENTSNGYICVYGELGDLNVNVTDFADGDSLYLSEDTAGAWVTVQPEICIPIGWVANAHASTGKILVKQNHTIIDTATVYGLDTYVNQRITDSLDSYFDTTATRTELDKIADDTVSYQAAASTVGVWDNGEYPYKDGKTLIYMIDSTLNPGVIKTITVTDDGGLDISWSAGEVYTPAGDIVITGANSGTCTDNTDNYLYWQSSTELTLSTALPGLDKVPVATIHCQNGDIYELHTEEHAMVITHSIKHGLTEVMPVLVADGMVVSEDFDATNTFDIECTAGEYYTDGHKEHDVPAIESRITPLIRWFLSADNTTWNKTTADAEISVDYYDPLSSADTTAITINRWVRSIVLISETEMHWIFGREQFVARSGAENADNPGIPPGLDHFPICAAIVTQQGEAAFTAADFIDIRPSLTNLQFGGGVAVTDHGSLAGLADDDHPQYGLLAGTPTISGDWVNTAFPWADNEVADDITVSNYTLLGSAIWDTLDNKDSLVYMGASDTTLEITDSSGTTIIRPGANSILKLGDDGLTTADSLAAVRLKADTLEVGGDLIVDFAGNGLDVNTNELEVDTVLLSTRGYTDSVIANTESSLTVHGDFTVFGNIINDGFRNKTDTTYARGVTSSDWLPDIPIVLTDTASPGDEIYMDSSMAMHFKMVYIPGGWNGHTYWATYTPLGFGQSVVNENPHVACSDDGIVWTKQVGATAADTIRNPIYEVSDFSEADFLSDPEIFVDADGDVNVAFRITYTGDSVVIRIGKSSDGIDWSETYSIISSGVINSSTMSPSILYLNGLYHLWVNDVYQDAAPPYYYDSSRVRHWTSEFPESLWTVADTVCHGLSAPDSILSAGSVWHSDIIDKGLDELVCFSGSKHNAYGDRDMFMYVSYDGGSNWTIKRDSIMTRASWYSTGVYTISGYFVDDMRGGYFMAYLSGYQTSGLDRWHTGLTEIRFDMEDAIRDSLSAVRADIRDTVNIIDDLDSANVSDGGLSRGDINWGTEYLEFSIVHGAPSVGPGDSVILLFPHNIADVPVLFTDSAINTNQDDTAIVSGTIPYNCIIDSIIFGVKGDALDNYVNSVTLLGPTDADASNLCDSSYGTNNTDRGGGSFSREAIELPGDSTSLSAVAGERFAILFDVNLDIIANPLKIYYVQLAVTRQ